MNLNCSLPSLSQLCTLRLAQIIKDGEKWPFDTFISAQIGDEVFKALSEICIINEEVLKIFAETTLDITRFYASCMVQSPGLKVLKKYKNLISLRFVEDSDEYSDDPYYPQYPNYVFTKRLIEENIHREAAEIIRHLDIVGFNKIGFSGCHNLSKLESLCLRESDVGSDDLGGSYNNLRSLDISKIEMNDFLWAATFPDLEKLILHDVTIEDASTLNHLTSLSKLRHLDVSSSEQYDVDLALFVLNIMVSQETSPWPELRCLDMAGAKFDGYNEEEAAEGIRQIVKKCPNIRMISLVISSLTDYEFEFEEVEILNSGTLEETIDALDYYLRTDGASRKYMQDELWTILRRYIKDLDDEELCQTVELVCFAMKKYLYCPDTINDCFNFLSQLSSDVVDRLPRRIIQSLVNRCFIISEVSDSIHDNAWSVLCQLKAHTVEHVNHHKLLSLALRTSGCWDFVACFFNTLGMISFLSKTDDNIATVSLNALWNMTDDFPNNQFGASIKWFERTVGEVRIEKRALVKVSRGTSVARLEEMKPNVVNLLSAIFECFDGHLYTRSEGSHYFAYPRMFAHTGILSIILTYGKMDEKTETMIDSYLQKKTSNWAIPSSSFPGPIIAFRSFKLFERIMADSKFLGARLWCIWGLLHVFSKDSPVERDRSYPEMLKRSPSLLESLKTLYQQESVDSTIDTLLKSKDSISLQKLIEFEIKSYEENVIVENSAIVHHINILRGNACQEEIIRNSLNSLWIVAENNSKFSEVVSSSSGLEVLKQLLKKNTGKLDIERKTLAVLSKVCEVEELVGPLIADTEFVTLVRNCAKKNHYSGYEDTPYPYQIDRSYFSAAILSNFLTYGIDDKTLEDEIDTHLKTVISNWSIPDESTSAGVFRTFDVFERIMNRTRYDGPRLWCVWSLLSVLSNATVTALLDRNYPKMLKKSPLLVHVKWVQQNYEEKSRMSIMAKQILDLVGE